MVVTCGVIADGGTQRGEGERDRSNHLGPFKGPIHACRTQTGPVTLPMRAVACIFVLQ